MTCSKCGVDSQGAFCSMCGARVGQPESQSVAAAIPLATLAHQSYRQKEHVTLKKFDLLVKKTSPRILAAVVLVAMAVVFLTGKAVGTSTSESNPSDQTTMPTRCLDALNSASADIRLFSRDTVLIGGSYQDYVQTSAAPSLEAINPPLAEEYPMVDANTQGLSASDPAYINLLACQQTDTTQQVNSNRP
jgi:hypothetical protein